MRTFGFIIVLGFLASCGLTNDTGIRGSSKKGPGTVGAAAVTDCAIKMQREVFTTQLRPAIEKHNCTTCHQQKQGSAPKIAMADLDGAFNDIMADPDFMVLKDPASSKLVQYMNSSHNCTSCSAAAAEYRGIIEAWAAAAATPPSACGTPEEQPANSGASAPGNNAPPSQVDGAVAATFGLTTTAKAISLGSGVGATQTLQWNLNEMNASLGPSVLEVRLVRDSVATGANLGTYTIRDVRVGSSTVKIRVQDIRVRVNGQEVTMATNFSITNQIINQAAFTVGAALPFPILGLPTNPAAPITQSMALTSAADQISFEFKAIGSTTAVPIPPPPGTPPANLTEPEAFAALVSPVLNRQCLARHRTQSGYIISGVNTAADRTATLGRVTRANPAGSNLLQKGTGTIVHAGGTSILVGSAGYQAILDWIARTP